MTLDVEGIGFLGIPTDRIDEMATFLEHCLGLTPGHHEPGWMVYRVPTGNRELVELFRPGEHDERLLPEGATGPTVAFNVRDLDQARADLVAAGTEIVLDVTWANDVFQSSAYPGFGWLFFRAPDGRIYCVQQVRPIMPTTGDIPAR